MKKEYYEDLQKQIDLWEKLLPKQQDKVIPSEYNNTYNNTFPYSGTSRSQK